LSTTAIKDGQQGHAPSHPYQHRSSTSSRNTLDAERADRISRLAGLERVATARQGGSSSLVPGAATAAPPGYFDGVNSQLKERSTVGSASATGSVGGRTTWASGSDVFDADKMSEDQDDGVSSGGFSEENASLVGFGEGASSTISGPISSRISGRQGGVNSPTIPKANLTSITPQPGSAMGRTYGSTEDDTRMSDATASEADGDPAVGQYANSTGTETAERIMRERMTDGEPSSRALGSPEEQRDGGQGLGKFYFESK
jgi:hypothetical protein